MCLYKYEVLVYIPTALFKKEGHQIEILGKFLTQKSRYYSDQGSVTYWKNQILVLFITIHRLKPSRNSISGLRFQGKGI